MICCTGLDDPIGAIHLATIMYIILQIDLFIALHDGDLSKLRQPICAADVVVNVWWSRCEAICGSIQ